MDNNNIFEIGDRVSWDTVNGRRSGQVVGVWLRPVRPQRSAALPVDANMVEAEAVQMPAAYMVKTLKGGVVLAADSSLCSE